MNSKYSTLRKSHTYIVVPRNVDPAKFISVPETQKEKKESLVKSILVPFAVLFITAGLLFFIGYLVYSFHVEQEVEKRAVNASDNNLSLKYESAMEVSLEDLTHNDSPDLSGSLVILSPCLSSPCHGEDSSCESHDNTFTCYCGVSRYGRFCEKVASTGRRGHLAALFQPQSYIRLKSGLSASQDKTRTSVKLKFRTKELDGSTLLKSGGLTLSIVGGHVRLQYSQEEDALLVQSLSSVAAGEWHSVVLHTYHADLRLQVANQEYVTASLASGNSIRLGEQVVLGGGFTGCLKDVKFGLRAVNLLSKEEPLLIEANRVEECGRMS